MNDVIVQFARLWGMAETLNLLFDYTPNLTEKDRKISRKTKAYDSMELLALLTKWAKEYEVSDEEDTCDFFYRKLDELIETKEEDYE